MGKWKSILKLRPFLKKYRLILVLGIVGILFSSVLSTPIPYLTGLLLDKVLMGSKSYQQLYLYIGGIGVLYLLQYVVSLLSKNQFIRMNSSVVNEMRTTVMKKVLDLPMSYLSTTQKGYVQQRISECDSVGSIFSPGVITIFLSIADALLAIGTMFAVNWKLALLVLILTPIFFFTSKASAKGFMKNTKDMMESAGVLSGESFEIMNGIEEIKVLNGKERQLAKFRDKTKELSGHSIRQGRSINRFIANIGLINTAGTLLILLASGILILQGQFTVGLYTSFSLYSAKIFASTQGIATLGTTLKPVCLSIERLYELLDKDDENTGKSEKLGSAVKSIEFQNVGFRYQENLPAVLDGVSFEFKKGNRVLVQGENGCGKTTLIKLLLGLYEPTSGTIRLNGVDSKSLNRESLREHIGIVSQSIFLFRGTVLDNILYGQNTKSRQDVETLVKSLRLDGYIARLANGLDTEISQNSAGVSGGQAQIIAFLRALLSNKEVIILDEPVSNVDAETRDIILQLLKERRFGGILIVISHQTEGMDFLRKSITLGKSNGLKL
ncbi:MAG TPA: ABC transporter ATP-binding protein [Caproicibacter sp.]|nr:ABC transporter ATP-binding protein [Caproicibacter sp.]